MSVMIAADSLAKVYRIGTDAAYATFRESIMSAVRAPVRLVTGRAQPKGQEFWALKDASFEVNAGDVVGIVGRNGAGKSTLLKILSRITPPTRGSARIYGRVGSLLEVGTGFHPELSGRDNIYLNGAILGMGKSEIAAKFEEIVEFAEVGQFIDTPVKRYSSGMYMRLAFSVAAHLEPEILLVDEVLSVGDAAFQQKCVGRMRDVASEGRTVLFVSHNVGAVVRLCTRAILLDRGVVAHDGTVDQVVHRYLESYKDGEGKYRFPQDSNKSVQFTSARITTTEGEPADSFDARHPIVVQMSYHVRNVVPDAVLGLGISSTSGVPIFTTGHLDTTHIGSPEATCLTPGYYTAEVTIPGNLLMPGGYQITVGAVDAKRVPIDLHDAAMSFIVEETGSIRSRRSDSRPGVINIELPWSIMTVAPA